VIGDRAHRFRSRRIRVETIVCGAGSAGLAAAAALRAVDGDVTVLERTDRVAAS
jgi:2-polyprenyl-6-methoxyphenol hydroxylase-like FAD-dependent oxidoreductase